MSKRHKKKGPQQDVVEKGGETPEALEEISSRGKKVIWAGIAVLCLGFYVLTLTDPNGRNWASSLSPFLILGGYAIVAIGIFVRDPENPAPEAPPAP